MTNNLPFLQLVLSLCTPPHPSLNCLIFVARILASPASPSSTSDQPPSSHPGAPSRHLRRLLCALIGRVAGSQWLDCQMTSKKGFKLVETAGHVTFVNPSHQPVMEQISQEHAAVSSFLRFKAFVPAQNDHQRQIPPLGKIWHGKQSAVFRDQFETVLMQHSFES